MGQFEAAVCLQPAHTHMWLQGKQMWSEGLERQTEHMGTVGAAGAALAGGCTAREARKACT